MDRRTDYKMALLIEAVIHEAAERGRSPARELAAMGVPFEVALRVVTRPAERRTQFPPPNHPSVM